MLKRLALLVFVSVVMCCFAQVAFAQEAEAQAYYDYDAELEAAINYYFPEPGLNASAHAIVACESGYGADIYNEYSSAYGPWQFMPDTSYGLGFDHGAMWDPWYATYAARQYYNIAGWSPWSCAYY